MFDTYKIEMSTEELAAKMVESLTAAFARDAKEYADIGSPGVDAVRQLLFQQTKNGWDGFEAFRDYAGTMLSGLAIMVGGATEVRAEIEGNTVRLLVFAGETYIGCIEQLIPGGAKDCMTRAPFAFGCILHIDGEVQSKFMCTEPSHRSQGEPS